ncbi:MAG: hypothetical protein M3Z04_04915 [Chloroflexota bacterium]|nr:hypothetical protein [Chloroflexota bacterium]
MNTQLKLVSYNLCKGGNRNYQTWTALFDSLTPDIFLAQESSPLAEYIAAKTQPFRPPTNNPVLWAQAGDNYWGSAVFVRAGTLTPLPPLEYFAGWVVGAEVSGLPTPDGSTAPLHIYSIHTPAPHQVNTASGKPLYTYAEVVGKILNGIQEQSTGATLVIGGDFNITISARQPNEKPENKPGEREIFDRLREQFGLINCWQTCHPTTPLERTLRHLHNPDSKPYHGDGLFVPAAWQAALRRCDILTQPFSDPPSDHNAIQAIFEYDTPVA